MKRLSFPVFTALLLGGVATGALAQDPETFTYDALGRLIERETTGGANSGEVVSLCYDAVGNRTSMVTNSTGTSHHCDDGTGVSPGPSPSPSPSPTPPPSNNPPTANTDMTSGPCLGEAMVNVTANDSDPEGNVPLTVTGVSLLSGSGDAQAMVMLNNQIRVTFAGTYDYSVFQYTVEDSFGAASTGTLEATTTTSCYGGGGPGGGPGGF